jgi:hypothetical protein
MNNFFIFALIISIPLILGILLRVSFKRNKNKDFGESARMKKEIDELEKLSERAECKVAQIVSFRPEDQSRDNPGERIVNFRLAIKTGENEFETLPVRWKIDNIYLSNFQQGNTIQVKVYDKYVFPTYPGARLIPDSVRS